MTRDEAKRLQIGDTVRYSDGMTGRVIDRDYARFMVEWDDGMLCSYPHTGAADFQIVAKVPA